MTRYLRFAIALLIVAGLASGAYAAPAPKATSSPEASATAAPTQEPPDIAIPKLQARLKINPSDREALSELTSYYLQTGRPDLALQTSDKLMQLGVKTGQVYYFHGYANLMMRQVPQATADLENASNLEPTNILVLSTLADLYSQQGRFNDAERIAKRALTFNKDNKNAYMTYGQVLESEQKYDDARAQYETAAKMDPKDIQPIMMEARTYVRQNAIALALSLYDRALAIEPNNQDALYAKAQILAKQHNVKDAVTIFERLRTMVPDAEGKAALRMEEARLYATEKMDSDADATFRDAIATYPNVPDTHVAYGDYLASQNKMQEAEAEWQQGLGPNRDNRQALARLGELAVSKKDSAKAIEFFKRLSEVAPTDPAAWASLGSLYADQRDWKNAHDSFRHAYDLTHTPETLKAVGSTDLNLRNYKEAQQIFEALEKNGQDYIKQSPDVIFLLGQAYDKQGMNSQARGAYTRFLAYLKPGTQTYSQVKKLIDDIDHRSKPAPKKTG